MNIEKGKIIEVCNSNHKNVLKYSQIIVNTDLHKAKEIVSQDLNSLLKKVRLEISEWE